MFTAVRSIVEHWRIVEGRFYPASALETLLVFTTFSDRASYKTLQWIMVSLCITALALLVGVIVKSSSAGILAAIAVGGAMQFRNWFDPYLAFGVLLPSLAIKVLVGSMLLLFGLRAISIGRKIVGLMSVTVGSILWATAMLQYEVAILLVLPLVLAVGLERRASAKLKLAIVSPIAIFSLGLVVYSAMLRSQVANSPAYSIDLSSERVVTAFIYQVFGSLPLTVSLLKANGAPSLEHALRSISLVGWAMVAILAGLTFYLFGRLSYPSLRVRMQLWIFGLGLVLLPAVPISISHLRQDQLGWGNAYLPVLLQVMGVGVVAVAVLIELRQFIVVVRDNSVSCRPRRRFMDIVLVATGASVSLLFALTAGVAYVNNDWAASSTKGWRGEKLAVDVAKRTALFEQIDDGVLVSGIDAAGFGWLNATYLRDGTSLLLSSSESVPPVTQVCDGWLCTDGGREIWAADVVDSGQSPLLVIGRVRSVDVDGQPILGGSSIEVLGRGRIPRECSGSPVGGTALDGWLQSRCMVTDDTLASLKARFLER